MRNIENLALSAANEMIKQKTQEVKKTFDQQAKFLLKEYFQIHSLIGFYEGKFKTMTYQMAQ